MILALFLVSERALTTDPGRRGRRHRCWRSQGQGAHGGVGGFRTELRALESPLSALCSVCLGRAVGGRSWGRWATRRLLFWFSSRRQRTETPAHRGRVSGVQWLVGRCSGVAGEGGAREGVGPPVGWVAACWGSTAPVPRASFLERRQVWGKLGSQRTWLRRQIGLAGLAENQV